MTSRKQPERACVYCAREFPGIGPLPLETRLHWRRAKFSITCSDKCRAALGWPTEQLGASYPDAVRNDRAADPIRIGARMRALRKERGLSAKRVALMIGIAHGNYLRTERGLHEQQIGNLARFCTAVGVQLAELFVVDDQ